MERLVVFPELRVCVFAGVVDSEDIPLNLSRELLQESVLIRCSAANTSCFSLSWSKRARLLQKAP